MQLDDPNDPQEPESPPPAPVPEPEPAPPIDLDQAYDVIAQKEGWDPRLTRYEIQEHKRRVQDFEREKKEWERERSRQYQPPTDDGGDPYMRRISGLERLILEEREEKRQERENQRMIDRISYELESGFIQSARQSGMTQEKMEASKREFYSAVNDLYPDPRMIQEIGADRAARNAFRYLSSQSNGRQNVNPYVNGRGPTATRTIPGSPQPYTPAGNPMPPEENLSAEQLDGETDQQYEARLRRIIEGAGLRRLPDGAKVASR